MNNFVSDTAKQATGQWDMIFKVLEITIPAGHKHGACPICAAGKDRFRCDDLQGRGTWICSQCGAGDGLDLIKKVKQVSIIEAAQIVAQILGTVDIQYKQPILPDRESAVKSSDINHRIAITEQKVLSLLKQCTIGFSPYLQKKGLDIPVLQYPAKQNHLLFLPIQQVTGQYTGAQFIDNNGQKRFIKGCIIKGSFIDLNQYNLLIRPERFGQNSQDDWQRNKLIIITEGFATALSIGLICRANICVALSAYNLRNVAQALRQTYPDHQIVIAADNDGEQASNQPHFNIGIDKAREAAIAIKGYIAVPPVTQKMDWDDYRQHYGLKMMQQAFRADCERQGLDILPYLRTQILING